jgi:hypothetical protein
VVLIEKNGCGEEDRIIRTAERMPAACVSVAPAKRL